MYHLSAAAAASSEGAAGTNGLSTGLDFLVLGFFIGFLVGFGAGRGAVIRVSTSTSSTVELDTVATAGDSVPVAAALRS